MLVSGVFYFGPALLVRVPLFGPSVQFIVVFVSGGVGLISVPFCWYVVRVY